MEPSNLIAPDNLVCKSRIFRTIVQVPFTEFNSPVGIIIIENVNYCWNIIFPIPALQYAMEA